MSGHPLSHSLLISPLPTIKQQVISSVLTGRSDLPLDVDISSLIGGDSDSSHQDASFDTTHDVLASFLL